MKKPHHHLDPTQGVGMALAAALLFGASTPFAKLLLTDANPWMLAALLYLGSGLGLAALRALRRLRRAEMPSSRLQPGEWPWLAGAIAAGGVAAPVLLMFGLSRMPAAGASLLLNAESVFTALLAWFAFRENFDRRIAIGMVAIVAGSAVLSWPRQGAVFDWASLWPGLAVLGACLGWGLDNNLTRKVALADAGFIAMSKGLVAGGVNLALALFLGAQLPSLPILLSAGLLGFASYGVSLVLFVLALRHLGTARTGAYFAVAPFFGAVLAVALLGEAPTPALLLAGGLMALGVWLHVSERHAHLHMHEPLAHAHSHVHGGPSDDGHHDHAHEPALPPGTRHSHPHAHAPVTHSHAHFPDVHHRHRHG
uniref:Putative permease n=1 Tax=mine drainage metagenome TaxID=410659 RepID=E6PSM1_9ZZZZ